MEWQPIETAPKDGTQFIAFAKYKYGHYINFCMWTPDGWYDPDAEVGGKMTPTHWMPLPDPPSDQ